VVVVCVVVWLCDCDALVELGAEVAVVLDGAVLGVPTPALEEGVAVCAVDLWCLCVRSRWTAALAAASSSATRIARSRASATRAGSLPLASCTPIAAQDATKMATVTM
jgi:hypothetical protein